MMWLLAYAAVAFVIGQQLNEFPFRGRVLIGLCWLPLLLLMAGVLVYDLVEDYACDDE